METRKRRILRTDSQRYVGSRREDGSTYLVGKIIQSKEEEGLDAIGEVV